MMKRRRRRGRLFKEDAFLHDSFAGNLHRVSDRAILDGASLVDHNSRANDRVLYDRAFEDDQTSEEEKRDVKR